MSDSQVGQHLVECVASKNELEWKILDSCCTVEKLMAIEAKYISKLEPVLNKRDEFIWAAIHTKILNQIIILTWEMKKEEQNLCA